jgi:CheY-like chemotaxis protein
MNGELARILLIEDDAGDVEFTLDEFRELRLRNEVTVIGDGLEAIDFLEHRGRHADAPTPDIVLLDLNLPGVDGRVVLDRILNNPRLNDLTVVVLTSSPLEEQMLRDFGVPSEHFFRKPVNFAQLAKLINGIDRYYLVIDRLTDQ